MLSGACDGPDGKSAFLRMLWIKLLCILYKVTNTPENTLLILGVMLIHVPLQTESHIADVCYLETPSHGVRCTQQPSSAKWKRCMWDWTQFLKHKKRCRSRELTHAACLFLACNCPSINPHFRSHGESLTIRATTVYHTNQDTFELKRRPGQ